MFLFFAASAAGQSIAEVECTNPAIPATTPSSEFTIVSDGSIIRHEVTRLEWQRCSMGQTWDGATCQGEAVGYFWQEALYIAATTVGDWRLPNIRELESLVERCRADPAINLQAFPNTPSVFFWSSTPSVRYGEDAWVISLIEGSDRLVFKGFDYYGVRLVRGGQ